MTGKAVHARMFADERKRRGIMIELASRPCRGLMAGGAVPAKLSLMGILCGMTGKTITRSVLVDARDMTGFTLRVDV